MYNEFNSLKKKNLIALTDYSLEEIKTILQLSHQFKEKGKANFHNLAAGKNVALLFDLPSLRTRSAFSLAVKEMGGIIEYYSPNNIHNESLLDIARVMSKIFDLIIYRAKFHESIEILAKYSEIPVINAMSPAFHPVQGLTDIFTIQTYFKNKHKIKIINFGDNQSNVSNSLFIGAVKLGYDYIIVAPEDFQPKQKLISDLNQIAHDTGAQISVTDDMSSKLLVDADVVYTDAWTLIGKTKDENEQRYEKLESYRVTTKVMNRVCKKNGIYMHCLPSAHNLDNPLEVTNSVFESKASVVFEQAENKLYVVKALIALILGRYEKILL